MANRISNWQRYVPIIETVRTYRRDDASHDIVAGLVVGVVTVPQAVAYAILAGLPAQAGLYACLVPMILYTIFGSSRQLVVGPVAVAALMVAATVREYAPSYGDNHLAIATVLCLQAGLLLWLLRLFRLGGIVNILSHPVISGFVNGAAILIIVSQLPAFTGITSTPASDTATSVLELADKLDKTNPIALTIAALALATLWAFRYLPRVFSAIPTNHALLRTGPMFVAFAASIAVSWGGLEVATVGYVPAGLPAITIPPLSVGL